MNKKIIEQTALTIFESIKETFTNDKIEELKKENEALKAEIEALKQDKIYSSEIKVYEIIDNKAVYFSQEDLNIYLRCMYQNIKAEKYSIGINKIAEKTKLHPETIKAIRNKLIHDGIIKVDGLKTIITEFENESKEEKTDKIAGKYLTLEEVKNVRLNKIKDI
jgi:hypothetical protein